MIARGLVMNGTIIKFAAASLTLAWLAGQTIGSGDLAGQKGYEDRHDRECDGISIRGKQGNNYALLAR